MRIARVFPQGKTIWTPTDQDCYFGPPELFTPSYDEVHISVVFTWDKNKAEQLAKNWEGHGKVIIGGPAYNSPCEDFIPGKYVAPGVVFTTRGCPNQCGFCFVPKREGKFRELPIVPGNIVQDNNILASSDKHWEELMQMLRGKTQVKFSGGLEAARLTEKRIQDLRNLSIKELYLACDTPGVMPLVIRKIKQLVAAGFSQHKIRVYVICGKDQDEEEARMEQLYLAGSYPFAQLYQPEEKIKYSREWRDFATKWSRPAATVSNMNDLYSK